MSFVNGTGRRELGIIAIALGLCAPLVATRSLQPLQQPAQLRPGIPSDVAGPPTQDTLDTFSWQLFVALNWPTKDGQADRATTIGQASATPRVWELYTDPIDLFQSSSLCPDEKPSADTKRLRMSRDKTGAVDGLDVQAGSQWPLIDQSRNFALVEIAVNDVHRVGHVAYVNAVHSDGSFDVEEYNWNNPLAYGTRKNVHVSNAQADFQYMLHF